MTTEQGKQPFDSSIVQQIRKSKSAEQLCHVAKALIGMFVPEDYRRLLRNALEQKISELGLFREVPRDIADARMVLRKED